MMEQVFRASIEPELKEALRRWLNETWDFDLFVTLATNQSDLSRGMMRDRLKKWDQRVNRALLGPKWLKKPDDRLWFWAFSEKPGVNPHWHLLIRHIPWSDRRSKMIETFTSKAPGIWQKLFPGGSTDIVDLAGKSGKAVDYVSKMLHRDVEYQDFVTPDEFRGK